MGMSIQTNPGAEFAAIAATRAAKMMDMAMVRLSSGKRINSARDDAAGIQVAIRMEAEINGLASASRNASDAQAAVDTAEGGLKEIHTLLLRMREIAVSAASDTKTEADRDSLQTEVGALETEITRIGSSTTWGGINLLDGSHSKATPIKFQLGPKNGDFIKVTLGYVHAWPERHAERTIHEMEEARYAEHLVHVEDILVREETALNGGEAGRHCCRKKTPESAQAGGA